MAVVLSANIDCPECSVTFEGRWEDDSDTPEDMDQAPVQTQICPDGHKFEAQYEGWTIWTEAG